MSRILVWSPNYAPEPTGIPPLVTDAAEWLAARGHRVDVVTALPNYPQRRIVPEYRGRPRVRERRGEVDVHRSWLYVRPQERFLDKALYEVTFAAGSLPAALARLPRADAVVALVPTLLSAAAAAAVVRGLRAVRRAPRLVLWYQDLVLEAARSVDGIGPAGRAALRATALVEASAARAADAVVVCSPGFREHLARRGVDGRRIVLVPNWVDAEEIAPRERAGNGRVRFLYAGNLGFTQGFETLVEAARALADEAQLAVVGDGNAAPLVRRLAASADNVSVEPPVARDRFPELLASADVHVVVQRRVSGGANLPSKIGSYLASGRPIVASIGLDTPAADMLRESGGALLVPPESPSALAEAMRTLSRRPDLRSELGRRGRAYAVRRLGRAAALERLEGVVLG